MLKKSASFVLASLRGLPIPNRVRIASSLAAALLGSLFEHPAVVFASYPSRAGQRSSAVSKWFFRSLQGLKLILVEMALRMLAHDLIEFLWSYRL